jgi:hypothetical protein
MAFVKDISEIQYEDAPQSTHTATLSSTVSSAVNLVVVSNAGYDAAGDNFTNVDFGGTSMVTSPNMWAVGGSTQARSWYLIDPPTGSGITLVFKDLTAGTMDRMRFVVTSFIADTTPTFNAGAGAKSGTVSAGTTAIDCNSAASNVAFLVATAISGNAYSSYSGNLGANASGNACTLLQTFSVNPVTPTHIMGFTCPNGWNRWTGFSFSEAAAALDISTTTLDTAIEGAAYSSKATATTWTAETWSINGGDFPSWVTLTDNADGTATFSGTPSIASDAGSSTFTLQVAGSGSTATQELTLTVNTASAATDLTDAEGLVHFRATARSSAGSDQYRAVVDIDGSLYTVTFTQEAT